MGGRPLRGSVKPRGNGRFAASVPAAKGSARRVTRVFADETQARRWVESSVAALEAERPLPDARSFANVARSRHRPADDSFAAVAYAWWDKEYGSRTKGSPDTWRAARRTIELYLVPFFSARVDHIGDITYDDVGDFVDHMAGFRPAAEPVKPMLLEARLYTLQEAADAFLVSKSVVRHAWLTGRFPNAYLDKRGHSRGVVRVPSADLLEVFGNRAPDAAPAPYGYAQKVSSGALAKLKSILKFARGIGLMTGDPVGDHVAKSPVGPTRSDRPEDEREVDAFTWEESRSIAEGLHVHHQLAFWLTRVAGLRIGEVYGLHVCDIERSEGQMLLHVHRQGGKWYTVKDPATGERKRVFEKEILKTSSSRRVLPIAGPLAELIDDYVEEFHDGDYEADVRLAKSSPAGAHSTFADALSTALARVQLTSQDVGHRVSPHFFRACMSTDVEDLVPEGARSRYLGHRIKAHDGGSKVTARSYTLRRKAVTTLVPVAEELERQITESIGTLVVSANVSPRAPRPRGSRPKAAAPAARGTIRPTSPEGEVLLSAEEVGSLLGIGAERVVRLGRLGLFERHEVRFDKGRPTFMYTPSSVQARLAADQELWTRRRICDELELPMPHLATLLKELGIKPVADTVTKGHRYTDQDVERLRAHCKEVEALLERCVSLQAAAKLLGVDDETAKRYVQHGQLVVEEHASALEKKTMVTRASVAALQRTASARASSPGPMPAGTITMREAKKLSGLTQPQLLKLKSEGVVFYRTKDYRYHVDRESLEQALAVIESLRVV